MGQRLTEFITSKISDPALRDEVLAELHWRGMDRDHGLIFEDSIEEIDTPNRTPQVGHRVQLRHALRAKERFQVVAVDGAETRVVPMVETDDKRGWTAVAEAAEQAFPTADLMTVVTHVEQVFPGLVSAGSVGPATQSPSHVAIRGENLHALRALGYSHSAAVDLIYIDPPYNTGARDWIYNDMRVDANDGYRHSKWLAFLYRRLELAKDLLKDTGVIIVAIGDDEHHRLRMLMDDLFGEQNFIGDVVWQGGVKNDARFLGGGVDYMLIYARSRETLHAADVRWREPKGDFQALVDAGARIWAEADGDHEEAVRLLAAWRAENKNVLAASVIEKARIDEEGNLYKATDLSWPGGGGLTYDVPHPVTGLPCKVPKRGWGVTEPQMKLLIQEGRALFGPDHRSSVRLKTSIEDTTLEVVKPTFYLDRRTGTQRLEKVLGDKRFPNPKDHEILMRWFRLTAPRDAVILDFFGGSGSTLEAVLRLNEEDGGTRQCIIATSNELGEKQEKELIERGHGPGDAEWEAEGVFEYVLRPRIETILTGQRPNGSTYDHAVNGDHRVEFFTLDYMDDHGELDTYIDYNLMAPLLWARAGAVGTIPSKPKSGESVIGERFAILFDVDQIAELTGQLTSKSQVEIVFIVAGSNETYRQAASDVSGRLPHKVKTIHLERTYLDSRSWIPRDRRRRATR